MVFELNTDLDNVNFFIVDDNILPELTTEDIESFFEGIDEEDEEFLLMQENNEEMSLFEQLPKENAQKTIPPASKTNVFNEKRPKGGQRTMESPPATIKETITKTSKTSEEVFREIMDIVDILSEDEEQLEKSFEQLKGMDAEQFRNRMKVYFKEFPEFEEHLTKNLQNSDSLSDLLDRMEEKYPEFKSVFKDSLIQEKLSQRSSDEEPKKKQPLKK